MTDPHRRNYWKT